MTEAQHLRGVIASILEPYLGRSASLERAAHVAQLWVLEPLRRESVSRIILAARHEVYGGAEVSEALADRLADRVMRLVDGVQ